MLVQLATNVPAETAEVLSYAMLVVVSLFLVSGPLITYYYWRKNKRVKAASSSSSA